MPRVLPVNTALSKLPEIVAGMTPGDTLELTKDGELIATVIVPERNPARVAGTAKDRSFWMAPDFDAPLEDFAEYME